MTDEERARRLFDWVISHIQLMAVMVVVLWVVMAVMSFGIIANARNGSDAAGRTTKLLKQNAIDTKDRTQSSVEDRRVLREAIQCVIDQFAEHRVTNQAVHDALADALGVPRTPPSPLPTRASAEDIMKVCAPFSMHQ